MNTPKIKINGIRFPANMENIFDSNDNLRNSIDLSNSEYKRRSKISIIAEEKSDLIPKNNFKYEPQKENNKESNFENAFKYIPVEDLSLNSTIGKNYVSIDQITQKEGAASNQPSTEIKNYEFKNPLPPKSFDLNLAYIEPKTNPGSISPLKDRPLIKTHWKTENFHVGNILGRGKFSNVYLAK
jgi:hypothetical protein